MDLLTIIKNLWCSRDSYDRTVWILDTQGGWDSFLHCSWDHLPSDMIEDLKRVYLSIN